MRFFEALLKKFWVHKWLWLYGMIVLFGMAALAFTAGMRLNIRYYSYQVYSPNLWLPYLFASTNAIEQGTSVSFTFYLFSQSEPWPWDISVGLLTATIAYWTATAFVVSTTVAAICGGLHLRRKKLVLWIDVAIVLLFITCFAYADARIVLIPIAWRFAILSIILSILILWTLSITLGHRPPFLGLGRRKAVVAVTVLAAIACLGIIGYYDSNSIRFTPQNLKPWTWTFIAAVWLLTVIWLLYEISRKISFRLRGLIPHLCAFGAIAALALTMGIQSQVAFGEVKEVLIRVLWLPHFNISHLISLPANDFANLYSKWGLDIYRSGFIEELPYSFFKGWNIVSFIFTLMWWAIIARILVVLGRRVYAALTGAKEVKEQLQPVAMTDDLETPEA